MGSLHGRLSATDKKFVFYVGKPVCLWPGSMSEKEQS